MTALSDLPYRLRRNLVQTLGVGVLGLLFIGLLAVVAVQILPAVRLRRDIQAQLAQGQADLQPPASADELQQVLQTRLDRLRQTLAEQRIALLTPEEAALLLGNVYRYAEASGVQITRLEAQAEARQPTPAPEATGYHVQPFQLMVSGPTPRLLAFVTHIKETARLSLTIDHVTIDPAKDPASPDVLTMHLLIYTLEEAK